MRIDRYLYCIRLIKSRTLAQTVIGTGYVRIDGQRVEKPSADVHIGSVIALPLNDRVRILRVLALPLGGRVRVVRVLALPQRRGPAPEARSCYEELGIDGGKPAP